MARDDTLRLDLFKGIVALLLLITIVILLLRGCSAASRVAATTLVLPKANEAGQVTFAGLGQPGATVQVVANGVVMGTTSVAADGRWSLVVRLDAGDYQVSARTLAATGELLNKSEGASLSVPKPAPAVAQAQPATPAPETATRLPASATPQPTATPVPPTPTRVPPTATAVPPTPTPQVTLLAPKLNPPNVDPAGMVALAGSGQPGTKVEVVANGVVVGSATVDSAGRWTMAYQAKPGEVALAVQRQGDPQSRSGAVTVTVPASQGQGQFYIVQEGDCLSMLATRYYGDPAQYTRIVQATNALAAKDSSLTGITNPDLILPGQKLWIPAAP